MGGFTSSISNATSTATTIWASPSRRSDVVGQVTDTRGTLKKKGTGLLGQLPLVGIGQPILFLAVALSRVVRRSRLIGRMFSSHALQINATRIAEQVAELAASP
ncbi:MAG: hypothetical protein ACI9U2_000778 [Bradymonadia bacterium]|jgi:hypothetical protein